jgi:hypothetical protein
LRERRRKRERWMSKERWDKRGRIASMSVTKKWQEEMRTKV